MDDLFINSTLSTPEINFKKSGHLCIKGKSLPEDPKRFFDPLFLWINDLSIDQVNVDVKLDYVSTSSSKRIMELIKAVDTNNKVKQIKLNWFYEMDDFEMLEFGQIIERNLKKTKITYIESDDLED